MKRSVALVLSTVLSACAPVFSDLQSAKLVGKGRVEATPGFSSVSSSGAGGCENCGVQAVGDGSSSHVQNHAGLQLATGVDDKVDLRVRYEHVWVDGGGGVNVLGFGPKIQLFRNYAALYVPVGFAFGGGIDSGETWAVHPTLLLTGQVHPSVEINWSAKYLVPFSEEAGDNLLAFNVGLGLGPANGRWAIRPEFGWLLNPGEEGHFTQFSVGVSVRSK
jgi:hypothetical protein